MPELIPPEEGELFPRHGGGSDRATLIEAQLVTSLDLAQVVGHYTEQLERNGWECRVQEEIGPYIWSTWAYFDDARHRHGTLFLSVLQHPGMLSPGRAGPLTERPEIVQQYTLEVRTAWTARGDRDHDVAED
jgi:hypothetical protein